MVNSSRQQPEKTRRTREPNNWTIVYLPSSAWLSTAGLDLFESLATPLFVIDLTVAVQRKGLGFHSMPQNSVMAFCKSSQCRTILGPHLEANSPNELEISDRDKITNRRPLATSYD
jgi:hypothetical protein